MAARTQVRVALIRAIGPVTHAKMRMAALAEACREAGLADVSTIGNTGNLLFRSDLTEAAARTRISQVVEGFGLDNAVFLDTPARMATVIRANPFPDPAAERPAEIGVCTFHRAPDWRNVTDGYDGPEEVAAIGRHLVVLYPPGTTTPKINVEKLCGAPMTQRNWRVFAGLAEKAAALARA